MGRETPPIGRRKRSRRAVVGHPRGRDRPDLRHRFAQQRGGAVPAADASPAERCVPRGVTRPTTITVCCASATSAPKAELGGGAPSVRWLRQRRDGLGVRGGRRPLASPACSTRVRDGVTSTQTEGGEVGFLRCAGHRRQVGHQNRRSSRPVRWSSATVPTRAKQRYASCAQTARSQRTVPSGPRKLGSLDSRHSTSFSRYIGTLEPDAV